MAQNSYKSAITEARADIMLLVEDIRKIERQVLESSSVIRKELGSAFKVNNIEKFNELVGKQKQALDGLSDSADKYSTKTEELKLKKQALNTLTGKEIANNRLLAKNNNLQTQATSKLAGAYGRLYAKQQLAKKALRDLIAGGKATRAEIKKAQKEYDKLTKKVNMANKATSNFSKTGLGKLTRAFRNLLGGFGLVMGVQLFADFTKAVFNNLKVLDKLEFSLRAVIKNEGELARTRAFLNDISIRYGAELVSTTERYIKFLAAAKQSNLALSDTEKIFETVTEAAGVMGLKTDELTGIYLALEQMLSKGKVTTEELRRQLGERLPGAFGIMANALGVTTVELDKMLRKGEVLSADVLPKFAEEVQKAFSLDKIEKVTTLQASVTNLTSSWQLLMEELRTGQSWISKALMATIDGISKGFRDIADAIKGIEGLSEDTAFADYFKELQENEDKSIDSITRMMQLREEQSDVEDEFIKKQQELSDAKRWDIGVTNDSTKALMEEVGVLRGKYRAIEAYIQLLKDKRKADALEKEQLINKIILKDKSYTQDKLEAMSLEDLRALWVKLNVEISKNIEALKGSIAWHKNNIKVLKEKRDKLATNQKEYAKYTEKIYEAESALIRLETAMKGLDSTMKAVTQEEAHKKFIEILKGLGAKEGIDFKGLDDEMKKWFDDYQKKIENGIKASKAFSEMLQNIFGTLTDTFSEYFDIDTSKFGFIFDELVKEFDGLKETSAELFSGENIGAWADLSKELIGSVLDASMKRYELELMEAQRVRDITLNNDLATEEEKEAARRKYERKEREIKTKAAKQERQNTLIKIAVDTAASIAKVLAQTGVLAPFAIPAIVGLGLAQAAFVASQPLPKFAKGTEKAPEGWAYVDENVPEVHTDKHGKVKSWGSSKGANLRYLKSGDKIYPSREDYFSKNNRELINSAMFGINLESNGGDISSKDIDYAILGQMKGLREDIDVMGLRIEKMSKRPIKNNVKVELEDNRAY